MSAHTLSAQIIQIIQIILSTLIILNTLITPYLSF